MGYMESGLAAQDSGFRTRMEACIFAHAQLVLNESVNTPGHPLRAGLARAIILDPTAYVQPFVWLCATDAGIAPTITIAVDGTVTVAAPDGALDTATNTAWNPLSRWAQ